MIRGLQNFTANRSFFTRRTSGPFHVNIAFGVSSDKNVAAVIHFQFDSLKIQMIFEKIRLKVFQQVLIGGFFLHISLKRRLVNNL